MKNIVFDFDLMGQQKDRATKKVVQYFSRAGAPIVQGDVTPSVRRTAGVSYREMALTFADGQTVTLRIKQSGDVFQVLINGKVTPMKNQDDHAKAIGEIVKHLDAGRAKFQAALAKTKAVLPKGIKSSAPKMEEALKAKAADLDAAIAQARTKVDELRKELGEGVTLDSAATLSQAKALASRINEGAILDSVGLEHAKATLESGLYVVDTNYPINVAEGNMEQANLEKEVGESIRKALGILADQQAAVAA